MRIGFNKIFIFFMIYSFGGWLVESIFRSLRRGSLIKTGFLKGPFCPIYGFGAMAIIIFLNKYKSNVPLLFISSVFLTGLIEYMTSYGLEKILAIKLWGYSHRKFNINGRVCLQNGLLFGILSIFLIKFIHPLTRRFLGKIPDRFLFIIAKLLGIYLTIDTVVSVINIL